MNSNNGFHKPVVMIHGMARCERHNGRLYSKKSILKYLKGLNEIFDIYWVTHEIVGDEYTTEVESYLTKYYPLKPSNIVMSSCNYIKLLLKSSPDLILLSHNQVYRYGLITVLFSNKFGLYIGNEFSTLDNSNMINKLFGVMKQFVMNYVYRRSEFIICRGKHLQSQIQKLYPDKPTYITEPLMNVVYTDLQQVVKERFVLFVGNLSTAKGFDILLNVFNDLSDDLNFSLVVIGPNRGSFDLSSSKNNKIKYLGYIDDPHLLASYYHSTLSLIVPSKAEAREGVPRVISEALYYGANVIATPLKSIESEFESSIKYFDGVPPSEECLKNYLLTLNGIKSDDKTKAVNKDKKSMLPAEQHSMIITKHLSI